MMALCCRNRAWRKSRAGIALLLTLLAGGRLRGQMPAHAVVSLVTEADRLEPGRTAWIGLLFDVEPGWHIYWVNPGDSGLPPTVKWQMPGGFRAGAIRWPVPSRLTSATTVDYGYEGQVLLPLPLDIPARAEGTAPFILLEADISYLICREVCIPAKAEATLAVPPSGVPAGAVRRDLFRTTRERWPAPLPAGAKVESFDAGPDVILSIETGSPETSALFFPLEPYQIDNAAPQVVAPGEHGLRLTLRKADPPEPFSVLKGVLVLGAGRAFEIEAPVRPRP
jgi:thiol:disulfide interchange protein DsbD